MRRLALLLFGLSLFLPALRTTGGSIVEPKWPGFSWLANVLVVPTLLTFTLGVACLFLGVDRIVANEAGTMTGASPGPGYFVWLNVFAKEA